MLLDTRANHVLAGFSDAVHDSAWSSLLQYGPITTTAATFGLLTRADQGTKVQIQISP
jgi:hypothetical protein